MKLFVTLIIAALNIKGVVASCQRLLTPILETTDNQSLPCLMAKNRWALAVCLLQANTVSRLLECIEDDPAEQIIFDARGLISGSLDMASEVRPFVFEGHIDGLFHFLPRLLLSEVFNSCPDCQRSSATLSNDRKAAIQNVFQRCPRNDWIKFLDCLCRTELRDIHIEQLERYVLSFPLIRGDDTYNVAWTKTDFKCRNRNYAGKEGTAGLWSRHHTRNRRDEIGNYADGVDEFPSFPDSVPDPTTNGHYEIITPTPYPINFDSTDPTG